MVRLTNANEWAWNEIAGSTKLSFDSPDTSILEWSQKFPIMGDAGWMMGKMTVPLSYTSKISPDLTLSVLGRAADETATLGTMLFHCGGPGSDFNCVFAAMMQMPPDVKSAIYKNMNVWSINQRGIGEDAAPSLSCGSNSIQVPASVNRSKAINDGYQISDFTECDCAFPDGTPLADECYADIDGGDMSQVKTLLNGLQERGRRCRQSAKFQLNAKVGNEKFNFLDYVGTRSLTQDIDLFRKAVGAARMSIYGMSYGTGVGAAFGSTFPDKTDKLVLNGNLMNTPDVLSLGKGVARASAQALSHLLRLCSEQSGCVWNQDPFGQWKQLVDKLESAAGITTPDDYGKPFRLTSGLLTGWSIGNMVGGKKPGLWRNVIDTLACLNTDRASSCARIVLDQMCAVPELGLTWSKYRKCIGPAQLGTSFMPQMGVGGVDYSGRYTVDQAARHWQQVRRTYKMGSSSFIGCFGAMATQGGTPAPGAPFGSPTVRALVVGNLYDPSTGYSWSQEMHKAFPAGSMMTWQGVGHLITGHGDKTQLNDPVGFNNCTRKIQHYLLTGELPMNGYVCRNKMKLSLSGK